MSDLITRVRKGKNGKEERIVYYGGYKILDSSGLKLKVYDNLYKCNYSEMSDDIISFIEEKKSFLRILSEKITFNFKLFKITSASKWDKNGGENKFEKLVNEKLNCLSKKEKEQLLSSKETKDDKISYTLKFDKPKTNVDEIVDIQVQIMCELKKNFDYYFIESPYFKISLDTKGISEDELIKLMKSAVINYKGKDSNEKKYQHTFMLNAINEKNLKNFFGIESKNIELYPFEQEYGITNYNKDRAKNPDGQTEKEIGYKSGRVDCVFYSVEENKLKDIYLIELKIDSGVIGGENGVYTHLDDIDSLFSCDKIDQISTLKGFIKYRYENYDSNKKLDNKKLDITGEVRIHFYTVFAYTDETEKEIIERFMKQASLDGNTDIYYSVKKMKHCRLHEVYTTNKYDVKFFFDVVKKTFSPREENSTAKDISIFVDPTIILEKINVEGFNE